MLHAKIKLSLGRKLFFKWRNKLLSGAECQNNVKHCQSQALMLFINYFNSKDVFACTN